MRIKFLTHPVLVVFTTVTFLFLVTGCERTVTKHDSQGKPYDTTEFDPAATLCAVILWALVLGAIAASGSDSGTFLHEEKPLLAYAKTQDVMTDALPDTNIHAKLIQVVDLQGNLISRHLISLDRLQLGRQVINLSEIQLSTEINQQALKSLIRNIAETNSLNSFASSIEADVSWLSDYTIKINAVNMPQFGNDSTNRVSELTLASEHGLYHITAIPDKESTHISVKVSQVN